MSETDDPIFEIDKIRILVSDAENRPRSECWSFYSKGNDVYIGPEPTGGTSKLSFHADNGMSGDGCNSQWGLSGPYARKETDLGTTNLLRPARWRRPETPRAGFAQVASILFPTDFMKGTIRPFKAGRKRIALPLAPAGRAIEVGVFYSREAVPVIEAALIRSAGTPIAYMALASGEHVIVAAREVPFDPSSIPPTSEWGRYGQPLSGAPGSGETMENCGAILFGQRPADGEVARLAEVNGITVTRNDPAGEPGPL